MVSLQIPEISISWISTGISAQFNSGPFIFWKTYLSCQSFNTQELFFYINNNYKRKLSDLNDYLYMLKKVRVRSSSQYK